MAYTKLETYRTDGYTSTDAEKRKRVYSDKFKADNAADTINPAEVKAKVDEIKELVTSVNTDIKTKVNACVENSGKDTLNVDGKTYEKGFEGIYTDFDLSGFTGELDSCITEADEKFNELQEANNATAKASSVADCKAKGGEYHHSTSTVESVDAF